MRLFSYKTSEDEVRIGVEWEGECLNLTEAFAVYQHAKRISPPVSFAFLQVLVEMGYCSSGMLHNLLADTWVKSKIHALRLPEPIVFDLPIHRPSKVIAIGRNYAAHVRELDHPMPTEPIFFCKAPSALIPHQATITIPEWLTSRVDHEAELGVVIGKIAKNVGEKEALDYVAGYTIVNDITARTIQQADIAAGNPWFRSKSLDSFCPVGPYLVPADAVPDPQDLEILLTVNNQIRQKDSTKNMLFPVARLIAEISRYMTLMPGDLIATGTPEGVGPIEDGDTIEITITGLGTLKNTVKRIGHPNTEKGKERT